MISGVHRYYETLGLGPGASLEEVRRAYRELVQVWHPDRFMHNPKLRERAQEELKAINESYARLRERRSASGGATEGGKSGRDRSGPPTRKHAAAQDNQAPRRRPKVALVVEREPEARRALRKFLSRRGYRVVEASDGSEAISAFVQGKPEMVVLGAERDDGLAPAILKRLRAIDPEAAFIMAREVEGLPGDPRARASGALYINKPINFGYLASAMKRRFPPQGGIVNIAI